MRSAFGRESKRLFTSVALVVGFAGPGFAQSLPTGGSVAAGAATIATPSGTSLVVTQTSRNAVINWRAFSVGQGNSVAFQNGSGATLNRVTGNVPSRLDGTITATGSLFLVNPAGVTIGTTGRIATGGSFLASTLDVPDADFMKGGDLTFKGASTASVVNYGEIGSLGGDVALIARKVENAGTIEAPNGTAALAAGYEVLVKDGDLDGGKFVVKVGGADTEAKTSGKIRAAAAELRANGGNVYALAGNTNGIIAANGTAKTGGRIFLTAGDSGTVEVSQKVVARSASTGGKTKGGAIRVSAKKVTVSGTLDAKGDADAGGSIVVSGSAITLGSTSRLDASGTSGGTVLVGGDFQGGSTGTKYLPETVATAQTVDVAAGATIAADGSVGAGGKVVVWSDEHTAFQGAITATGATVGGDAEVSGKAVLDYRGTADLRSASGRFGTLLLDPYNLTIKNANSSGMHGFDANADNSILGAYNLMGALLYANVTVTTGSNGSQAGNITVSSPITWSSGSTLTLSAAGNIVIDAAISGLWGGLTLSPGASGTISASAAINVGTYIQTAGTFSQVTGPLPTFAAGDFRINGGTFIRASGGDGSSSDPYIITDVYGLQGIGSADMLGKSFALANDIDASRTSNWNDGAGFVPIGNNSTNGAATRFTGIFDGQGHVISGMTINRPTQSYVGLFGYIGSGSTVTNLGLNGGAITGTMFVGGLAGANDGTVENAHAGINVRGDQFYIGGLLGTSSGDVQNVYATGAVEGGASRVGGLIGSNIGYISSAYATGTVTGSQYVGGLVGQNTNAISQAYASGAVTGTGTFVGGLAGYSQSATLSEVYATGNVAASGYVGGLVGYLNTGSIAKAYATGSVTGTSERIGGLVGYALGGSVSQAYASGRVTGGSNVAGFIGYSFGPLSTTLNYFDTDTTGQTYGISNNTAATGVTGRTTSEARTQGAYSGWNFTTDWYQAGDMRPIGRWEAAQADTNGISAITNLHQLALVTTNLAGSYVLAGDLDASETAGTNVAGIWGPSGFAPIGGISNSVRFTGTFDGRSSKIKGLTINVTNATTGNYGLFGYADATSTIKNIQLDGGSVKVSGTQGGYTVGMLAGRSDGAVQAASATGSVEVSGSGRGDMIVGGLIGQSTGAMSDSSAAVNVTVSGQTWTYGGGLIGSASGSLTRVHASGTVSVTSASQGWVGGLAGVNYATVSTAYATGAVTVTAADVARAGGLFGLAGVGSITTAYATGAVQGTSTGAGVFAGGLIGYASGVALSTAYASGATNVSAATGNAYVGGLVGYQFNGSIAAAYANGSVTASSVNSYTGGLAGYSSGSVSQTYATGAVSATFTNQGKAGGLLGFMSGTLSASYFDKDTTHQTYGVGTNSNAAGVTGLTTSAFQDTGSFIGSTLLSGWSYSTTWAPPSAGYYPVLYALTPVVWVNQVNSTSTYGSSSAVITSSNGLGGTGSYAFGPTGDGLTLPGGTVTVDQTKDVGTYISALASENSNANSAWGVNYRLFYYGPAGNNWTVTPATLTVTATGSQTYGSSNPSYSYTTSGWQNSQGNANLTDVAFSTTANATSGVNGYYTASVTSATLTGAAQGNYTFNFVPGTFTITPASLTVTATGTQTYGSTSPTYGFTASGWMNGQSDANLTGLVYSTSASAGSNVGGTYTASATGGLLTGLANGNYTLNFVSGAFTVTPATLEVSVRGGQTYGSTSPTYIVSTTGWQNGQSDADLTGLVYSTNATATSNVGNGYTSTVSGGTLTGAAAGNYVVRYVDGPFKVTPATLTVTATGTQTYGSTSPTYAFTAAGWQNGQSDANLINVAYTTTAGAAANVGGSYTATATSGTLAGPAAGNYTLVFQSGAFDVTPATLTVTATGTQTYGSTSPTYAFSATGWQNGQSDANLTNLAFSTSASAVSNAGGTYNASASGGTLTGQAAGNYTIAYQSGAFTVTPATLTVTATGTQTYGSASPTYAFTATGWKNGQTDVNLTGLAFSTSATATSNAGGSYSASASNGTLTGAAAGNYTVAYQSGAFTVTPATLTVAVTGTQTYGSTSPTYAFTATGWQNGQTDGYLTDLVYSSTANAASNAGGTYTASATGGTLTGPADGNYTLDIVSGAFTVTPAPLYVRFRGSQTYGSTTPSYIFAVSGWQNGQTDANLTGLVFSTNATAASNVGTNYTASASGGTLTGPAAGNYVISYASRGFRVDPASLTVTATGTQTYGSTSPTYAFTATGWQNGQTDANLTGLAYSTTANAASNAGGTYSASATGGTLEGAASGNYTITFQSGDFTVTQARLTVTASDASKVYDGQAFSGGNGVTFTGFVNNEDASVLGGTLGYGGTAQGAVNAGTYVITASGLTSGNYAITYETGGLIVGQRAITVAADAKAMTYGDGVPGLTWSVTSGSLVNNDTLSGSLATSASSTANVGTYAISRGTLDNANYAITYQAGAVTVAQRAITVAADAKAMTYGDGVPGLTWSVTSGNLVNGDTLTGALATAASSAANVGTYAVNQGTLGASANYALTYVDGVLNVTPRAITVAGDDAAMVAGTAVPALGWSVTKGSLANGDTLSGALATAATPGSPAGLYAILQGTLAASANYALTYVPGALTVTAAPVPPNTGTPIAVIATLAATPNRFVETSASNATVVFTTSTTSPLTVSGGDSGAATQASGGSTSGGTTEDGGSGCTGGATSSAACTATPHPENRRVGRFLTFSAAAPQPSLDGAGTTTLQ